MLIKNDERVLRTSTKSTNMKFSNSSIFKRYMKKKDKESLANKDSYRQWKIQLSLIKKS